MSIKFLNIMLNWPIRDLIRVSISLYSLYLVNKHSRRYLKKLIVFYQYRLAYLQDNDSEYKEMKEQLFLYLSNNLKKSTDRVNILEIGIGCGNNFLYLPQNCVVTGLDPNFLCESFAYRRLNDLNTRLNKNIQLKDYLVGYAENMSYIRNNSIEVIVCTNVLGYVQDINQTLNEICRVLKPVLFPINIFDCNFINFVYFYAKKEWIFRVYGTTRD